MKRGILKLQKLILYLLSLTLRFIFPIKKGRVLLWATIGKDYGCNPMYISKYLVKNDEHFDVWWMFLKGASLGRLRLDTKEHIVWFGSLKYLCILNTAEFLITNHRTLPLDFLWKKRKGQKYIMTWHGSMPIKMVEADAISSIGEEYVKIAKTDSSICDLMLSDSEFFTNLIRQSFWYDGEILKTTLPRNQKFYEFDKIQSIRDKIFSFFGEKESLGTYLVLYAPTFRSNNDTGVYITDWTNIKSTLEVKYGKRVVILMRLHPNLLRIVDTDTLLRGDYVKNASIYTDMQELMVASDMLITDYSSTMFEFSLMQKPCILYLPDKATYDRGLYLKLSELPFAQSESIPELIDSIKHYDNLSSQEKVHTFVDTHFGLYEQCDGNVRVCEWMKKHSLL